jgi:hypothetical protein
MPSREASLRNLARARANGRPPRPWRSRAESQAIRMFVWQWLLGHGPWCSGRALARWLGVSHTHIQKLSRTLSRDENDFLRKVRYFGAPSIDGLKRAREESRQQRERGFLRTQPRLKWVEFNIGGTIVRDCVPTKPNAATLAAQNPCVSDAPASSGRTKAPPDYLAMYLWQLKMNAAREQPDERRRPTPVARRWYPGMRYR